MHMDVFSQQHYTQPARAAQAEMVCWRALEALHEEGLVRSLGISSYGRPALERLWGCARVKPAVLQEGPNRGLKWAKRDL